MFFVGIDLAWSTKNGTGVAVLEGNKRTARFVSAGIFYSDAEIFEQVERRIGGEECFVAVDAPLIVPNEKGRRVAEKLVGELFRKYNAGAYPANRQRLAQWTGTIRGEEFSKGLEGIGFEHSPYVERFEKSRKFFEVYPHPSMVVLFGLDRILRYKAKPNHSYKLRWAEFDKYAKLLKRLRVEFPKDFFVHTEGLKGRALKEYEDKLDAIFCAYIAYHCWHNPEKCAVLGDMKEGYIMTPILESMRKQLASRQKELHEF